MGCALAHKACQSGYSSSYLRLSRLLQQIAIGKGDGRYDRILKSLNKLDLLIIDSFGLKKLPRKQSEDLLEIVEERHNLRSTLVTSQLPVDRWHAINADPTLADDILDRLVHMACRIDLDGDSMRKKSKRQIKHTVMVGNLILITAVCLNSCRLSKIKMVIATCCRSMSIRV